MLMLSVPPPVRIEVFHKAQQVADAEQLTYYLVRPQPNDNALLLTHELPAEGGGLLLARVPPRRSR